MMEYSKRRRKDLIKNRNDKRYIEKQKQLERAIGKCLKSGWLSRLKTSKICSEAGVWKTTFYDHYIHVDEAISLFFHKMDPELRKLAIEIDRQNLEVIFYKILYFVYQNREYYETIIGQGYSQALTRIAEPFQHIIKQSWSNYGIEVENKCFCMFSWELGGALYCWGHFENFDFDRMPQYARKLSRLANNTTKRLVDC